MKRQMLLGGALLMLQGSFLSLQAEEVPAPAKSVATDAAPAATASSTNQPALDQGAPATPILERKLSAPLQELLKMAERGLGDDVLIAWIKNSPTPFNLSPDDIVYLTDLGLSEAVVRALIEHRPGGTPSNEPTPAPAPVAPINPPVGQPSPNPAGETPSAAPSVAITATPEFETGPQQPQTTSEVVYVPQPAPVQYNYFYSSLAPYGSWIEVPDYGLCWRPTVSVIEPGWRPYCQRGRWLYTNCGWYWQSDYSWGWAPFHYGRWWNHPRSGWVWAPDTVWAPAWVTWRYSDAYCGWAPLPPGCGYRSGVGLTFHSAGISIGFDFGLGHDCFTFVPTRRFHDRAPWRYALPPRQVVNVYNHTTVINNFSHNSHDSLVNEGPGRDRIERITRSEIPKMQIRDVPTAESRMVRSERNNRELAVYRPLNPTLPAEGSHGAPGRHEVTKSAVVMSPRALAENGGEARTVGSRAGSIAPHSITRLSQPGSPSSPFTEAALSKPSADESLSSARRTLDTSVPVLRPSPSGTVTSRPLNPATASSVSRNPAIEARTGTIRTQPDQATVPINPSVLREGSRSVRSETPAPAAATPANRTPTIGSSRSAYASPSGSVPRPVYSAPNTSRSVRSVPSESAVPSRAPMQRISPPLINQQPSYSTRQSISVAGPASSPNWEGYAAPSRPAPFGQPSYRQEVSKPVIVSPPSQYSAPAPVTRSVPSDIRSYSPGGSIRSVPSYNSGPVSVPQPARASPVYSAPRAPSSAPAPARATPSSGGGTSDRTSNRSNTR